MPSNTGASTLKRKRCAKNPMSDFDRLPPELRQWAAKAILPWRARSVQKAFDKALARTGCRASALQELDVLQGKLIRKDAGTVWGAGHPEAEHAPTAA